MCSDSEDEVKLSLTVTVNKERNKVLYAVADNHFVDILLSFLTLPLGRVVRILEKYYGDEAPTIGSLSSFYHSLADLDTSHFWTKGAKEALLNPRSSFEAEYERLKLDISNSHPTEYFLCIYHNHDPANCFRSVSMYYDELSYCRICKRYGHIKKLESSEAMQYKRSSLDASTSTDGVFTTHNASFIVTDDLHLFPNETRLARIITVLGITDADEAEQIQVEFSFSEIMKLLKASLISPTPLSDVILNNSPMVESVPRNPVQPSVTEENTNTSSMRLHLLIHGSTGKLLSYLAGEDFVEFLSRFFHIPLGGVEHLLDGKTCFKAIDNLYSSISEFIDDDYFKAPETKQRLMKPNLPHGCISENHILPLTEECLPTSHYRNLSLFSTSAEFPKGKGSYLRGPRFYEMMDDLTFTSYHLDSNLSSAKKQNIPFSDVKALPLNIGLKEALIILKASLSSTSVLSDALLKYVTIKGIQV